MLFNSFPYWIFFFIVAALFYSVPFRFGKVLLVLASYVFYMWWDWRFIVLILTSTVVLQIVLPIGVSFYTFASLSYTFDVYWGKMKAVRNPIHYALFIAFFPHLIAGPIIRARQFISQIQY